MIDFLNPWGWLALLSLPTLLAIYLFRRQARLKSVSSLFLWKILHPPETPGPKLQRLQSNPLMYLQLLALFLLALALAQPVIRLTLQERHHWVILDLSASMLARDTEGHSAWKKGVQKLIQEITREGSGSRWALVEARPNRRVSGFLPGSKAISNLRKLHPEEAEENLNDTLQFAMEGASTSDEVWVLTDRPAPSNMDSRIARWLSFGVARPNLFWIGAQRLRQRDGDHVLFSIMGRGASNFAFQVDCRIGNEQLQKLTLTSTNNEITHGEYILAPSKRDEDVHLQIHLEGDALEEDNQLIIPPTPTRLVLVDVALEKGPVRAAVEKSLKALPFVRITQPGEPAALRIESGERESHGGDAAAKLILGPLPKKTAEAVDLIGPYLYERHHPLMDGAELDGVLFGHVRPEAESHIASSLILAGEIPIFYRRGSQQEQWVWNSDLRRSTFLRSESWPIFIQNFMEHLRAELPGLNRSLYASSEPIPLNPDRDWAGALVTLEEKTVTVLRDDKKQTLPALGRVGWLKINSGKLARAHIAMLGSPESDLQSRRTDDWKAKSTKTIQSEGRKDYAAIAAFISLILMGGDWLWFRRRTT